MNKGDPRKIDGKNTSNVRTLHAHLYVTVSTHSADTNVDTKNGSSTSAALIVELKKCISYSWKKTPWNMEIRNWNRKKVK